MKQVGRNDLLNGWLKFHNTTVDELAVTLPEELKDSPEWWAMYAVTQEQHDESVEWAKDFVKKETKISKRMFERLWPLTYLNCAPSVIKLSDEK